MSVPFHQDMVSVRGIRLLGKLNGIENIIVFVFVVLFAFVHLLLRKALFGT